MGTTNDNWQKSWPPVALNTTVDGYMPEQYIGTAKALMFKVKNMMQLSGLNQFQLYHRTADGSIIQARSVYGNDSIRIFSPTPSVKPSEVPEGGYQIKIIRDYDHKVLTDSTEDDVGISFFYLVHNPPLADSYQGWPITKKYNKTTGYWSIRFTFPSGTQFTKNLFTTIVESGGFWIVVSGSKALSVQWAIDSTETHKPVNDPYMVIYTDEDWRDIDKTRPGKYEFLLPYRTITHSYNPGMAFASTGIAAWVTEVGTEIWNGRSAWPIWWKAYGTLLDHYDEEWFVEIPWPCPKPIYQYEPYTMFSVSSLTFSYEAICTTEHRIKESFFGSPIGYADYTRHTLGVPHEECRDDSGGNLGYPQTCWTFLWGIGAGEGLYPNKCSGSVVSSGGMDFSWEVDEDPPSGTQYQYSTVDNGEITLTILPVKENWIVIQGYTAFGASIEAPSGKSWLSI